MDNDIIPAKAVGMQTVWIRKGTAAFQERNSGSNNADGVIEELADLLEIFHHQEDPE